MYIEELKEYIKQHRPSKSQIAKKKINLCSKYKLKHIPTDIEVLLNAKASELSILKKYLQTKPTRSLSGVSVVAIMCQPHQCPHGRCIICPGGIDSPFGRVPQSYTGKEPATRRAIRNGYDPYLQVINRLEQYVASGHVPEKIELIIMGGTFISTSKKYRDDFIMYSFKAMNDFSRMFFKNGLDIIKFREFFELPGDIKDTVREKSIQARVMAIKGKSLLEREQRLNEKSTVKCVGLTIETRSDYASKKYADEMLRLGATRVEVGVQSVYDESLKKIERGHTVADNIKAIRTLKDMGFKINTHYMPGLFVSRKEDLAGMKQLFSDTDYRPDMLKIYPCMVVKGTKLYNMWKRGTFKPINTKQAVSLIAEFKTTVPRYCRIMRVQRDIPTYMTSAGVDRTNLRQYIHAEMDKRGDKCECIRCREIGRKPVKGPVVINVEKYDASEGVEFFISADIKSRIAGFCRLRFPSQAIRKEITVDSALVRELHVYGMAAKLGKKGAIQHRGIGKKLLARAEAIAKKANKKKMVVISGIGVRQYYRKLGYRKHGPYMVKNF